MLKILLLSVLAVAMIGLMMPSVFAESKPVLSFVDPEKDPSHYVKRYLTETNYQEWFDTHFPDYTIWEGIGITHTEFERIEIFELSEKDPSYFVKRYLGEPQYKDWFDRNFSDYTIWEGIGITQDEYRNIVNELTEPEPVPEPVVTPEPEPEPVVTPEPESEPTQSSSLTSITSPIKEGMWTRFQVNADFNIPAGQYTNPEAMQLGVLTSMYGLEPGSISYMKYQLSNIEGIHVEIINVTSTGCEATAYLVMKDGTKKSWMGRDEVGSGFCDNAQEIRNKKIGDRVIEPIFEASVDENFRNSNYFLLEDGIRVTNFDTININGKKLML